MRPPRPWTIGEVALLAFLVESCSGGSLHPVRGPLPGSDASGLSDTSTTILCPSPLLLGYATMSDQGGEFDGGSDAAPPMLRLDGGVTGGGPLDAGTRVVVKATDSDALAQFSMYAGDKTPGPLTIVVEGMIAIPPPSDGGSGDVQKIRVSSNKTVIGDGASSGFSGGGLSLSEVSNVIVQNLLISMPNGDDAGDNVDAIHVEKSHQIWIDHCDLSSNGNSDAGASYDDLVGISDGSDFVTVSWTRYHDHGATGIIGRSDSVMAAAEDADKEHVTFDHDWFENVASGPRARFGYVHIFNTYFDHVSDYGVAAIDGVNVRIENSVFDLVTPVASDPDFGPVTTDLEGDLGPGYAELVNNTPRGSGNNHITTQATDWTPPYDYKDSLDSTANVPTLVEACAGTGHISVPPTN